MEIQGIKHVQSKILNIFLEVRKICEENNIRYFAIGGTCLGAVRHNGFIPWDDDLDIAMPDVDFEKFIKIAPKELPKPLELIPIGGLPHAKYLFAKVHDTDTTFIEKNELRYSDSYKGVYIDIMPFCGIPSEKEKQKRLFRQVTWLYKLNNHQRRAFDQAQSFQAQMLWLVTKIISGWAPKDIYSKAWYRIVSKNRYDNCQYTGFLWSRSLRLFDKTWFDDYVDLPFETTTVRCPKDWDSYLTKHFGDYMKLPPEPEQVLRHSGGIVDLERSYRYYQEQGVERI